MNRILKNANLSDNINQNKCNIDINDTRIAASFYLGLDSAILKLLKKGSREQWIFKLQKVRRNQIYNTNRFVLQELGR